MHNFFTLTYTSPLKGEESLKPLASSLPMPLPLLPLEGARRVKTTWGVVFAESYSSAW